MRGVSSMSSAARLQGARTFSSLGAAPVKDDLSLEGSYDDVKIPPQEGNKRAFSYFFLGGAKVMYASGARLLAMKFISSMSASEDVLALASLEVDVSSIALGTTQVVKWRGKPVFIKHRTDGEIAEAESVDMTELRDPQKDSDRTNNPEWLVCLGVCTHLGCVPISNAGEYNGWFCPCHGSHYDTSGRIRKGPAPANLEVPPYKFMEDGTLLIG